MTDPQTAAAQAVWIEGDPLMEAIASAVWGRCARDDVDMPQLVLDDPRNIAAVAAAVARAMQPAPVDRAATPLTEVWAVWRDDEPPYGYFATVAAAKQATIDCWQETESLCPDYSWRRDGPRWELVVGGEYGGVYASRHKVYGTPAAAPADRAVVLRDFLWRLEQSAGDAAAEKFLDDNPELHRMADEEQQPETQAQPSHHRWYVETLDPIADEWAPGMRFTDRAEAVDRYQTVSGSHPTWDDGTPVRRRFVRETTSYTVEAAAVAQPVKEA